MAVLGYEPALRMALADDPSFPDEEEAKTAARPPGEPVAIDEWQSYFVRFYNDSIPAFLEKALFVVPRKLPPGLLELNFRNWVGLSRIGNLRLTVRNTKITSAVYQGMLNEMAEKYACLVFAFGSPVGQHYNKKGIGRDSAFVEYLFLCKYLLHDTPNLDAISDILVHDPHRKFEMELQPCAIAECQGANIDIVHSLIASPMARLRDEHPLQRTSLAGTIAARTGQYLYPQRAFREIKYLTVDTHENRFVKFFLHSLQEKVEGLHQALANRGKSYFNPDIEENLGELRKKIGQFLSHNMWREVGKMRYIPVSSQVLQRREGYRQLFALYSLLQLATHCDFLETDFKNLVEIKDLPTLYEYWCFFQIKEVMDGLSQARRISRIINEDPLTHELIEGLCIDYQCGAQLLFNATCGKSCGLSTVDSGESFLPDGTSYSHDLRPDIVVVNNGRKLIFDAKYKGQRGGFYGEEEDGTIRSCKPEDLDKMHTYRDAIKDVTGSFILYPGTVDIIYPCHSADSAIKGVGALALRPNKKTKTNLATRNNIKKIISTFLHPATS